MKSIGLEVEVDTQLRFKLDWRQVNLKLKLVLKFFKLRLRLILYEFGRVDVTTNNVYLQDEQQLEPTGNI